MCHAGIAHHKHLNSINMLERLNEDGRCASERA
jgi:hypothetical protein